MDTTRAIIDNWPASGWSETWIPIIIAVIAVVTTLISMKWTRDEIQRNARPYVWAASFATGEGPVNNLMGIRVKNNPAFIWRNHIRLLLDGQELDAARRERYIMFPDEASEWRSGFDHVKFTAVMARPLEEKARLVRTVDLEYSPLLNRTVRYTFSLQQTFSNERNDWIDGDMIAT